MDIVVTSGSGLETATKLELRDLGIEAPCVGGSFSFEGDSRRIAECNMFLATAGKVYVKVGSFLSRSFDELYEGIYSIPWIDYIRGRDRIIVNAKSVASTLYSLRDVQAISKKAIVRKLLTRHASLPENGAPVYVDVNILKDTVTVLINTSGDGLHKRGYRKLVWEAPIKETIAAAVVRYAHFREETPFADLFCGSGTFVIEAARYALNIAPGIDRGYAYTGYKFIDYPLGRLRREASEMIRRDVHTSIYGCDINPKAVSLALAHAEAAGVANAVRIERADMRDFRSNESGGLIVSNPPYGERLMEVEELRTLYRDLGRVYRSLDGWRISVITAFREYERCFGKRATKERKIYNGKLECRLYEHFDQNYR